MKQTVFEKLIAGISSKLRIIEELGTPITNDLINEKIDEIAHEFKNVPNFEITSDDFERLKFHIGNLFNVRVGEKSITLHNPDLPRWFDSKKADIEWNHWNAYSEMLFSQGRSKVILDANESVIDDVLDYSGDPTTPGSWSRKGLVMGNVQSGKTQNYLGLINKAIDCGYKTIILLGGHLNDLRRQTQERVDAGILGVESRHLAELSSASPRPIGVGIFRQNSINTGTTTIGDFNKAFAGRLGFKLTGKDPVIFTIKKHTGVMERLYNWINDTHFLNVDAGKKLEGPLLLIDDEADYASINTKHHKEEVTKTNDCIRQILSLFDRNTYVGYTATPFANIFIDPDEKSYTDEDDLFPSDFMIKIPIPDNYLGQDFFFGQKKAQELEDGQSAIAGHSPTVTIKDHGPIYELKSYQQVKEIPDSLKQAVRAFLIATAIRWLRGEKNSHNTMLVNISHLTAHQDQLERFIEAYRKELDEALKSFSGLGVEQARNNSLLKDVEDTYDSLFFVSESFDDIFSELSSVCGKVKVWAINQSAQTRDGRDLDYSKHKEHGLCAVVIGGHKLSRGLTLEGLSISYFARNSKAYDTLMQMCRWFGYRPNYDDLCRVFLPADSIAWYSFIAAAIRELYQELELMSRREQRPKDFGLKVREHPGAMVITAKNKIGWSDTTVRSQDLWGQVQRRFRFRPDEEINLSNLEYTKSFLLDLTKDSETTFEKDPDTGSLIFNNVDYSRLIDYIENTNLPEDDLGNKALINHLKKMNEAGLARPKVVVFNQKGSRSVKWAEKIMDVADRAFIDSKCEILPGHKIRLAKRRLIQDAGNGHYKVNSVHLGNPDDEKLFVSKEARKAIEIDFADAKKKPVSFDYLCSEARESAGLLIYLFAVAVGPDKILEQIKELGAIRLGHGRNPTVGYTISFPRPENLKDMSRQEIARLVRQTKHSYKVGKVYAQLQELSAYEEFDDE